MIINKENTKIIFIHIPKCGGRSIERSLRGIFQLDYMVKNNLILKDNEGNIAITELSTLQDYSNYLGAAIKDYYIFSIVRNPWRRMVSHYEFFIKAGYNKQNPDNLINSFDEFIDIYTNRGLKYIVHNYGEFLEDDKNTPINRIIKLEEKDTGLQNIKADIGVEIENIHMNLTAKEYKEFDDWKEYYTTETKDIVYRLFKEDIEKYEYEFK